MTAHTASEALDSIVKAYDIRGVAYDTFTPDIARALGAAFADLLDAGDMVVSHDMRVSSPDLATAFADGAVTRGSRVAFAGLSSTDQLYCASGLHQAAGAQFTASHNPAPDNGIKMCFPGARPVGRDSGLLTVRDGAKAYLESGDIPTREGGSLEELDTLEDYISTMLSIVDVPRDGKLTVVVDAANAMAGLTVPALAAKLPGLTIIPLYFELDGTFPNHEANPLDYANLVDLQAAVREHGADLGLAFDGDADRCIVVDNNGDVVSPSAITALIAREEIARAKSNGEETPAVVANLVSSRIVPETISAAGGRHVRSQVGHSLIKALMAKKNAVFGGEHSAHYYFRDFYFADSGMLAALYVLRALMAAGGTLSGLVEEYDPYCASGEINSRVESVADSTRAVIEAFEAPDVEQDSLDGVTLVHWGEGIDRGERWWISLRPSNTEPLLRLNVEAEEQATMERVRDRALSIIRDGKDPNAVADTPADHAAAQARQASALPAWVRERLQCPACGGKITVEGSRAVCKNCDSTFALNGGIPMMIANDAE